MKLIPKYQTAWGKLPLILNDEGREDWVAEHTTELPEVTITAPKPLTETERKWKRNLTDAEYRAQKNALHTSLQNAIKGSTIMGQTLMGGENSVLPFGLGIMDIATGAGTLNDMARSITRSAIPAARAARQQQKVAQQAMQEMRIPGSVHNIEIYPESNAVDWIYINNPKLANIGSKSQYSEYLRSLYPKSQQHNIVWHGSNADFSKGFNTAIRQTGSGAPETAARADMFFNNRPAASYQYVNGLNVPSGQQWGRDRFWKAKEILGKGMYDQENWQMLPWEQAIRTKVPNKKGVFNRDIGGSNGKWLSEYKAELGANDMSDQEFFTNVLGFKPGESFNQWVTRNEQIFRQLEADHISKGMYPAMVDLRRPIVEYGQDTYYLDRGLMDQLGADGILSNQAKNEFGSDVSVVFDGGRSNQNKIWWLGNAQDQKAFGNFVKNLYLNINKIPR